MRVVQTASGACVCVCVCLFMHLLNIWVVVFTSDLLSACVCVGLHDASDDFSVLCSDFNPNTDSTSGFHTFLITHKALSRQVLSSTSPHSKYVPTPMTRCDDSPSSARNRRIKLQFIQKWVLMYECLILSRCRAQSLTHSLTHTLSVSQKLCASWARGPVFIVLLDSQITVKTSRLLSDSEFT